MDVVWPQEINQLQHGPAPATRRQLALVLVQRRCNEDLFAVRVGAPGLGAVCGALLQLDIVGWAVGVAGEEDAGDEDQEGAEIGKGEDGVVDGAQNGALLPPRSDQVCVGGALRQCLDAGQTRAEAAEP